jgi:hypothetical protein
MTHAWCSDPSRDAAVRAAEDGRDRPLPTLGEAIAGPFAEPAERSSTVSNTGEGQRGLRTERVVLEVTHKAAFSAREWRMWRTIFDPRYGESVRVVEQSEPFSSACPIASGTVNVNGQDMVTLAEFLRHTTRLTQEAGVAKRERDAAISERESLREQLESVACRAATAETALAEIKSLDYTRAAVNGAAWQANKIAAKALEAASGEMATVEERVALVEKMEQCGVHVPTQAASGGGEAQCVSAGTSSAPVGDSGQGSRFGSGEPVAWGVATPDGKLIHASVFEPERDTATVVPLYRAPPQPRGWLTAEERENLTGVFGLLRDLAKVCGRAAADRCELSAVAIESLLARSSPPEVVKPGVWKVRNDPQTTMTWQPFLDDVVAKRDSEWLAALAASGVAVKEVGRE